MRIHELLAEDKKREKDNKGFTDKQIKQAYGIANDPRYAHGNMTGAVQTIEKLAKGLSDHPGVRAALTATQVDEARDKHCSDACCGSDVKASDCNCPPDCKGCNCNAKLDENVSTTSGAVATVAQPMGGVITRSGKYSKRKRK